MPEIRIEHWEADEYVIVIDGIGVVGQTLSKYDAHVVSHWLKTAPEIFRRDQECGNASSDSD